jgi:hypothetical protein
MWGIFPTKKGAVKPRGILDTRVHRKKKMVVAGLQQVCTSCFSALFKVKKKICPAG